MHFSRQVGHIYLRVNYTTKRFVFVKGNRTGIISSLDIHFCCNSIYKLGRVFPRRVAVRDAVRFRVGGEQLIRSCPRSPEPRDRSLAPRSLRSQQTINPPTCKVVIPFKRVYTLVLLHNWE